MESITHLSQKLAAERARNGAQRQPPLPETAPPPYSESEPDSDEEDDDDSDPAPTKLVINAANNIQGSNNLVPTSPSPLADATRFSTLLLHAVNQINSANATANQTATLSGQPRQRRQLRLDLTINCGTTIVGDRNVVGHVGIRPKAPTASLPSPAAAVSGAKRKAEDDAPQCEGAPVPKKAATGTQTDPE